MPKIVDAHIHIWASGTPRGAHRQQAYSAQEVLRDMAAAGVDAAIIQPPAWDPNANAIAIEAATAYPNTFGILGNFSLDLPDREEILSTWRKQAGMLGLRYILNEPKHRTMTIQGELDWLWRGAQEYNIPIAIAASSHLEIFAYIAQKFPTLRLIIDHLGVPLDATGEKAFLQVPSLEHLAKYSNIAIKATAVPAYADDSYPYPSIERYVQQIYQFFGPERFFWGSDITKLKCSWQECIDLFENHYTWIPSKDKELVMGKALLDWLEWNI
jgi:predicted TIM-barrel fold metal-dependent hydrolase